MITRKKDLVSILSVEYNRYNKEYSFGSILNRIKLFFIRDRRYFIWKFQKYMRKADYYRHTHEGIQIINCIMYVFYARKRNCLGEHLGFDFMGYNIPIGLQIYHPNVVINSKSQIGENLHLYGENVIGNNGNNNVCPCIGDNVMLGAGAKVFGNVKIADNNKIGAGAIVVTSFLEMGVTIGGVPAKRVK